MFVAHTTVSTCYLCHFALLIRQGWSATTFSGAVNTHHHHHHHHVTWQVTLAQNGHLSSEGIHALGAADRESKKTTIGQ